jgi:hypothetical protein
MDSGELRVRQERLCGSFSINKGYSDPRGTVVEDTAASGPPWQLDAAQLAAPLSGIVGWTKSATPQNWSAEGTCSEFGASMSEVSHACENSVADAIRATKARNLPT